MTPTLTKLLPCLPTTRKQTLVKDYLITFCINKHMFRRVNQLKHVVIRSFKTTFSHNQRDSITKVRCILVIRTKTPILNTRNNQRAQTSHQNHWYSNQPRTRSGDRVRLNSRPSHPFTRSHRRSKGRRATNSYRRRKQ